MERKELMEELLNLSAIEASRKAERLILIACEYINTHPYTSADLSKAYNEGYAEGHRDGYNTDNHMKGR